MSNNYLLYGTEKYLINEKITQIIGDIEDRDGEKPELVVLDGDETNANELEYHLTYDSLFSLSKVVVIKEPFWLKKSSRKSGQVKQIVEIFTDYFAKDVVGQTLVATTQELFENNQLVKLFQQNAHIIAYNTNKADLRKWLTRNLSDKGLKATNEALSMMVNSGQDMYYLDNLLEKYALAKINNITPQNLADELDIILETSIFNFTDALISKNLKLSLDTFYKLLEQRISANEIIPMINFQYTALAKVKAAEENNQKVVGLNPFVIKKMQKNTRSYTWDEIWRVFKLLLDTDLKMKSTSYDKTTLMEILIINICK